MSLAMVSRFVLLMLSFFSFDGAIWVIARNICIILMSQHTNMFWVHNFFNWALNDLKFIGKLFMTIIHLVYFLENFQILFTIL